MSIPTAIYGIIGDPLEHSLSPVMHNTAFKELGVDAVYERFPLKEDELAGFFQKLRDEESPIFGLNVTVPYKEKVIPYLDSMHPFAKQVMAVNTIVISKDRKLHGFNTDGAGFLAHLTELGFETGNKRVAILGAGGTARAIVAALCLIPERPEWIRIYNRTKEKADYLITDLQGRMDVSIVEVVAAVDDLNVELADILINATSLGLKKDDLCLVDEGLLHPNMAVYDVIYNPPRTKLLQLAGQKGAKTSNGLGMLFYQGVLAFQHWADTPLDPEIKSKMRSALEEEASA
jgi:shikimate dehydrogenase